jgi:hypothetical protein
MALIRPLLLQIISGSTLRKRRHIKADWQVPVLQNQPGYWPAIIKAGESYIGVEA